MLPRLPRLIPVVMLLAILAACTPHYNWREVRDPDKTFMVLLPAKPVTFTRTITVSRVQLPMTMTAAEVDNTTFAVGVLTLPASQQADTVVAQMGQALAQNLAGQAHSALFARVPAQGNRVTDMTVTGTNQNKPAHLMARFVVVNRHVFQLVVLATGSTLDTEQAETLLTSFVPRTPLPQ